MSQYKTGTATVTNGSATVTGTNTLWLANVTAGNSFTVAGDGVMYDVASVDSDTQITLSAPYAGTTASGVVYAIGTGFTVPDSFPEMSQGDIETATIFTRAMRKIQGKFSSILAGGANANFTAMPQVGGDPILENGSISNGDYTKYSDGTIIYSHIIKQEYDSTVRLRGNWTLPISSVVPVVFSGSPVFYGPDGVLDYNISAGNELDIITLLTVSDVSSTNDGSFLALAIYQPSSFTSFSPGDYVHASLMAYGRWK